MTDWLDRMRERYGTRRADPAGPVEHEVQSPDTDSLAGMEGLDEATAKAEKKLKHKRTIRKVRLGGIWGAIATGAAFVVGAVEPSLFAGYGPWAVAAATAVQYAASWITRSDEADFPTPTNIETMAETDAPTWAEIVDYLEDKGIMTAQQIVDDFEALASDEDLQIMIVSRINTDLDVPFVPESVEGMGMHAGYDVLQEVFQNLADEARERLA